MVDRYGCFVGTNDYQKMAAADDGAWVKYEDYEALQSKLERLVVASSNVWFYLDDYFKPQYDDNSPIDICVKKLKAAIDAAKVKTNG